MSRIHDLIQGSEAWCAFRLEHHGASEAAAMLGLSKNVKRNELLSAKHTGIAREFSDWVQANILDRGHEVEALARPLVEAIIGDYLYPVTCSDGRLSASCDGLTLDGLTAFEHKQWNESLAAQVAAGLVPDEHMPQCQQILLVTRAEKVVFVVSDGTRERMVYIEVQPDSAWFERIRAGWIQFDADLAAYVPPEAAVPQQPTGKAPETLPALRIEVTGMVTASNLAEFKQTALAAIRSVNRELSTDVDFANAESAVKWCSEVESRLAAAKEHALSQTASIDALFKTIDDISAEARQVRLDLDRLVKARKESIRGEIVAGAVAALGKHMSELNASIAPACVPRPVADFAGVIKGKRTVASLRDAVDTELARVKIEANAVYQRVTTNLRRLTVDNAEHAFLFPDVAALALKASDDLGAVIANRIAEHQAKEAARLAAETARIRAEEQAKAQREAAEPPVTRVFAEPAAPAVIPPRPAQAPANDPPTLTLGAINARMGPGFAMTAAFVSDSLGIQHAATDESAKLFRESDWPRICAALVKHVNAVSELQAA